MTPPPPRTTFGTMFGAAALAAALALSACGVVRTPVSVPEGVAANDPRVEPCRREAESSPQVIALGHRQPPPGYGDAYDRWRDDLRWAERNAFMACLVREGAIASPPTGVERVNPPEYGFDARTPPPLPESALPEARRPAPSGY